jgi:hypothetical protein
MRDRQTDSYQTADIQAVVINTTVSGIVCFHKKFKHFSPLLEISQDSSDERLSAFVMCSLDVHPHVTDRLPPDVYGVSCEIYTKLHNYCSNKMH